MGRVALVSEKLHVLVVGPSHCGKTELLHRLYVPAFPRVISLDVNGEAQRYNPNVIECTSIDEIVDVALVARAKNRDRWHIQAILPRAEYPRLFRMLAPEYKGSSAPPSFTRAVGGIALECSEAYVAFPNAGIDPDVKESLFRGRHHYLSFLLAAQRPASLNVATRSQADVIVTFRQTDPNELEWLGEKFGAADVDAIRALPRFHSAMWIDAENAIYWLDENRNVLRVTEPHTETQAPQPVKGGLPISETRRKRSTAK